MLPNLHQYMKAKYGDLPKVEVSKEEFITLLMETGKTKEQAQFQGNMVLGLCSSCMVGDKMVSIKQ